MGHIATGLRVGGDPVDPPFLVGTALPDFAAMARTRLGAAEGSLGEGIALHHATDHAFHAEGWFLDLERELRELFRDDGLPDGGARACAHVGPELLLDGALLDDPAIASGVSTVYEQIASPDDDVVDLAPTASTTSGARISWVWPRASTRSPMATPPSWPSGCTASRRGGRGSRSATSSSARSALGWSRCSRGSRRRQRPCSTAS